MCGKNSAENLVVEGHNGFKTIVHVMNAERVLEGAAAVRLGYAALLRATVYAKDRTMFWIPIGKTSHSAPPCTVSGDA